MSRELDAEVAEKVFGFDIRPEEPKPPLDTSTSMATVDIKIYKAQPSDYSTDIAEAWQIVEFLAHQDPPLSMMLDTYDDENGNHMASVSFFWGSEVRGTAEAPTAPEAICRAAISALVSKRGDAR